jgi:tRNA(Ile)-lysidine synthase
MPIHPFEARLAASWPPERWKDLSVIVAVSGGGDSVALLRGLAAIKQPGEGRLIAAHVNHKLRGADADDDQVFVERLCRQLGLDCEAATAVVDAAAGGRGQGIESQARKERYAILEAMAGRLGARFVVTAHTADDQAETILHRILRGTGLRGLAGMSRSRRLGGATLLRPLLQIGRAELAAYLHDRGQPFRTDATNGDVRFTRNRIRRELLPLLAEHYNPSIVAALKRLGALAGEAQALIDDLVCAIVERCLRQIATDEVSLDLRILASYPQHLVREALMDVWRRQGWQQAAMGFAEWDRLAAMVSVGINGLADGLRKRMFPGAVVADVRDDELRLRLARGPSQDPTLPQ